MSHRDEKVKRLRALSARHRSLQRKLEPIRDHWPSRGRRRFVTVAVTHKPLTKKQQEERRKQIRAIEAEIDQLKLDLGLRDRGIRRT